VARTAPTDALPKEDDKFSMKKEMEKSMDDDLDEIPF